MIRRTIVLLGCFIDMKTFVSFSILVSVLVISNSWAEKLVVDHSARNGPFISLNTNTGATIVKSGGEKGCGHWSCGGISGANSASEVVKANSVMVTQDRSYGHWRYRRRNSSAVAVAADSTSVLVTQDRSYGPGHGPVHQGHHPAADSLATTVLPVCQSGPHKGICVDSEDSCTIQNGEFYGYCYDSEGYIGVCCLHVPPQNATLPPSPIDVPAYDAPATTVAPETTTATTPLTVPTLSPPTLPNTTLPNITLPNPPSVPTFPNTTVPSINTTLPNITLPKPPSEPTFPNTTLPDGTLPNPPSMPTFPNTTVPNITLPHPPSAPAFPNTTLPNGTLPNPPSFPNTTVPNGTLPNLPPVPPFPAFPGTNDVHHVGTAPSLGEMDEDLDEAPHCQTNCSETTTDVEATFRNPSYPNLDTAPNIYQYVVIPKEGYCALRLEFLEALLAGRSGDCCSVDSVQIINSADGPTAPQCGLLQGYQYTVRTIPNQPVRIVITSQSNAHIWNIKVRQIACAKIRPLQDYQKNVCGKKNDYMPAGLKFSDVTRTVSAGGARTVPTSRLLKLRASKRRKLSDVTLRTTVADKLVEAEAGKRPTVKIIRGNETGINEYPWQTLIMVNGRPVCGASIINDKYILTAGHCVQVNVPVPLVSMMTIDVGDHDLRTVSETKNIVMRVERIIPNAQYEQNHNDIALVKLAGRMRFGKTIRPACLPNMKDPEDMYADRDGITTGWGRTEDSVISPVLRQASVKVISNEQCMSSWNALAEGGGRLIEPKMVCVDGGDVGPCNGDSGGPLVVYEEDRWRLIGLTSFGSLRGCAIPGVPTVYTRVSSFLEWIAMNIAE